MRLFDVERVAPVRLGCLIALATVALLGTTALAAATTQRPTKWSSSEIRARFPSENGARGGRSVPPLSVAITVGPRTMPGDRLQPGNVVVFTRRTTKPQLIRAAKKHRLHAFPTCDPFLTYVRSKTLDSVGPFGRDGDPSLVLGSVLPATAPAAEPVAGVDYSPTNVQEDDVDEPDIVKSNGRTMFTVADGTLRAIRLDGASTRLVGSLTIDGVEVDSLLLAGKRLLVLGRRQAPPDAVPPGGPGTPVPLGAPALLAARPDVVLTEVDVTNPAAMAVEASLTLADTTVVDAPTDRRDGADRALVTSRRRTRVHQPGHRGWRGTGDRRQPGRHRARDGQGVAPAASGNVGTPSNITVVAPFASGP